MTKDPIPSLISHVDQEKISKNLFYLSKDPLPYRKVNYTLPGHAKTPYMRLMILLRAI